MQLREPTSIWNGPAWPCQKYLAPMSHVYLSDLFRKSGSTFVRAGFINGLPGFVTLEADGELQPTALEIVDGKVAAIYVMRNPDKLRHLH